METRPPSTSVWVRHFVGDEFDDAWVHEVEALQQKLHQLDHPVLAPIIRFQVLGNRPLIVAATPSGRRLLEQSPHSRITPTAALDITHQLLEGLAHAHQVGVTHGQVEPKNIVLVQDRPVLLGTSVFRIFDDLERESSATFPSPVPRSEDLRAVARVLSWMLDKNIPPRLATFIHALETGTIKTAEAAVVRCDEIREAARVSTGDLADLFALDVPVTGSDAAPTHDENPPTIPMPKLPNRSDGEEASIPISTFDFDITDATRERIPGYQILEPLGSGTFSDVFRAWSSKADEMCAIKMFSGTLDAAMRGRIRREISAMRKLQHPNVVAIIDAGETRRGVPFVTMELYEGSTLATVLKAAPLSDVLAARILLQVVDGLAAIHAAGFVHRDIKPANIILGPDPTNPKVTIVDLGLVRSHTDDITRLTRVHDLLGTPLFMAPEQIQGPSLVGPPADLYAVGLMGHWMLSGEHPFAETSINGVITKQLTAKPPSLGSHGGLGTVIEALLAKLPASRPTAAEARRPIARVANPPPDTEIDRLVPDPETVRAAAPEPRSPAPVTSPAPEQKSERAPERAPSLPGTVPLHGPMGDEDDTDQPTKLVEVIAAMAEPPPFEQEPTKRVSSVQPASPPAKPTKRSGYAPIAMVLVLAAILGVAFWILQGR